MMQCARGGKKCLIVLAGPTGVGKTDVSIGIARRFGASVLSSDSRQIYREMRIGTAVPEPGQLAAVPHYFIGTRSVNEPYTAGRFETDALALLDKLFARDDYAVLVGGSGLYVDALCYGIDPVPGTDPALRAELLDRLAKEGAASLLEQLRRLDPDHYRTMDRHNTQRIVRALEVCLGTGRPYSSLRSRRPKDRPFGIVRIGLTRPRPSLYERIDRRTDEMVVRGLIPEARSLRSLQDCNALQTVGYRELFAYFDGKCTLDEAIRLIKRNSRRYAKRQMTWFGRDPFTRWFDLSLPSAEADIVRHIETESASRPPGL